MEKIRMDVYKGIPIIKEMIKAQSFCHAMGKDDSWLGPRLNNVSTDKFTFHFLPEHIEAMNQAIQVLSERVSAVELTYFDDKAAMAAHIKANVADICMPYICITLMKKPVGWYNKCMSKSASLSKYRFKEDDITQMNLSIKTMAARLRSIELTIDENHEI